MDTVPALLRHPATEPAWVPPQDGPICRETAAQAWMYRSEAFAEDLDPVPKVGAPATTRSRWSWRRPQR